MRTELPEEALADVIAASFHNPMINKNEMMKIINQIVLLLLVFLLSACAFEERKPGEYLFEIEVFNNAWGYRLFGYYLDENGHLYQYDHSHQEWLPRNHALFTEVEINAKYSYSKKLIGSVEQRTLQEKVMLIVPASQGELSEPHQICYDAGSISYFAYIYGYKDTYHPVLLYKVGDIVQTNLSEEAKTLVEWLNTIIDWGIDDYSCKL